MVSEGDKGREKVPLKLQTRVSDSGLRVAYMIFPLVDTQVAGETESMCIVMGSFKEGDQKAIFIGSRVSRVIISLKSIVCKGDAACQL